MKKDMRLKVNRVVKTETKESNVSIQKISRQIVFKHTDGGTAQVHYIIDEKTEGVENVQSIHLPDFIHHGLTIKNLKMLKDLVDAVAVELEIGK